MDPDLLFDVDSDQLWLYYLRETSETRLLRRTSSDGVHWSEEVEAFAVPNYAILSPAVLRAASKYELWSVNAGAIGCSAATTQVEYRSSLDGIQWSSPAVVKLNQPGFQVWHIDVSWVEAKKQYWALYAAYPNGAGCGETNLFFASSSDGINWTTFPRAALQPGLNWDAAQIYRSTFLYDPASDSLMVWYSAQHSHVWHTGFTQASYSSFRAWLENP